MSASESLSGIENCHILFLASFDTAFIKERLDIVQDKGILTIGEVKEFSQLGGIINFFIEKGRLRFEVNLGASRNAALKIGSQILMSAEIVQPSANNTNTQ